MKLLTLIILIVVSLSVSAGIVGLVYEFYYKPMQNENFEMMQTKENLREYTPSVKYKFITHPVSAFPNII